MPVLSQKSLLIISIDFRKQWNGCKQMDATERRQQLLEVLCLIRQDVYYNLACKLGVLRETIWHDIVILICSCVIETVRGQYGSGVRVLDGYYYQKIFAHKALALKQTSLLRRLRKRLQDDDINTINSILSQFAP